MIRTAQMPLTSISKTCQTRDTLKYKQDKHMRKGFLLGLAVAATAIISSCTDTNPNGGYIISGSAAGATDGDPVYLCEMQSYGAMITKDTAIIKKGQFLFEGKTDGAKILFLVPYHDGKGVGAAQFVLENAIINVDIAIDPANSIVKGGAANTLWSKLHKSSSAIVGQQHEVVEKLKSEDLEEEQRAKLIAELDTLNNMFLALHYNYIADNVPSDFSDMLLGYTYELLDPGHQSSILQVFQEKQPQSENFKRLMKDYKAAEPTMVGKKFTDFSLQTPEGKDIKLSDVVSANKLTLVVFWASWCGPCRAEAPNFVNVYKEYHSKGLEILGVSLDEDKTAWKGAIDALGLPWLHASDLNKWNSVPASIYNVQSIPADVLISQDGTIVSRDVFGKELKGLVESLLTNNK